MKIIIENAEDYILQVRAARSAIDYWKTHDYTDGMIIAFDDGSSYYVKRNKESVRVYRNYAKEQVQ